MRTLPLFSSVAQMPSGVVGAGAAATGAGAGCTTSLATGPGAAVATAVVSDGAFVADGAVVGRGAAIWAGAGAGFDVSATSSSSSKRLDLKPPKLEPERLGAEILMQSSELQLRGASMRMRWPSIWKETELPPAWADVVASSSAAAR